MADGGRGFFDKLIGAKVAWAREGRLLTGQSAPRTRRLPPGQREVKNWPVLDLGVQPRIDPARWHLPVDGLVAHPRAFDWQAFQALPQVEMTSDIHCVTAWSRYDNLWRGVSARHLIALVQPRTEARHVLFQAHDGYTTNLPFSAFAADDVILATHWQGRPLTPEHGGPVRVVVPRLYFWKSAKWVSRITFAAEDKPGFWELRGYHNEADPWSEQRYG